MRILFIIAFMVTTLAAYAASVVTPARESLDSLFRQLSDLKGAISSQVDFTGGWPKNGSRMGFAMMRGDGKGHTKGVKIAVPQVDIDFADSVLDIINAEGAWGEDCYKTTYDNSSNTAYSIYFNEKSDSLYMIRVHVENEPSLPYDWPFRSRYDASDAEQIFHEVPLKRAPVDWAEALVRLYDEVKYNFVFYPGIASRWDRAYRRNLSAIREAEDDFEKLRILQRMVASCADGHTFITFHSNGFEVPGFSPFTTVLLPEGLYIRSVESPELIEAGMRRGQKIVAVNGESPQTWAVRELKPYVCSSTPQWTLHEMYDGYNFSQLRKGTPMNLTLENPDGSQFFLSHKVNEPKWDSSLSIRPGLSFKVIDKNIGLLTIPHFQRNETTTFFDSVYPKITETDALIIDLRGNGGGNSGYADYIARHLIDKPIASATWTTRVYNPAFASWGRNEGTYTSSPDSLMPLKDVKLYLKPIVLLTDRGTFSAAEDFTALLKSGGRITQIGTATGGSTGNGVRPSLTGDGKIMANICSKHDLAPDGTEFVGLGLIPDIIVEESAASYFDPKRDDLITAAVSHLKSKSFHNTGLASGRAVCLEKLR